ncbi:MAG: glycogen debranching enzyme GlgX, partial [Candidatus Tumulicola sp.]
LNDLVSYDHKHNEANLEENRDGADENYSWNCGAEGATDDPSILALRERQKRNFFAMLLLSQGLPMLLAGDELGHTQVGNNNAYCQDNEIAWLDRSNLLDQNTNLFEFVRLLLTIRREHPVFRRPRFFRGVTTGDSPLKDITWFSPDAREMSHDDWNDTSRRCFGALLGGDTADRFISLQGYREIDDSFLIVVNGHDFPFEFTLPSTAAAQQWIGLIDTARWNGSPTNVAATPGTPFQMADRSFALFVGSESRE